MSLFTAKCSAMAFKQATSLPATATATSIPLIVFLSVAMDPIAPIVWPIPTRIAKITWEKREVMFFKFVQTSRELDLCNAIINAGELRAPILDVCLKPLVLTFFLGRVRA